MTIGVGVECDVAKMRHLTCSDCCYITPQLASKRIPSYISHGP